MDKENIKDKDADIRKEQSYQTLLDLVKSIRCMTLTYAKADMYLNIAGKFSELADYKDSAGHAESCKQFSEQTLEEINRNIYEDAQNKRGKAGSAADYKTAANEFRKVSGFMDADAMAFECDRLSIEIVKRKLRKSFLKKTGVLLCIIALIFAAVSPISKYYLANIYKLAGAYGSAIKIYHKLDEYKDSKEKVIECQYLNGLDLEAEKNFISAEKAYAAAEDYKDSENKKVEMDKLIFKNSEAGDIVELGNCKWTILDINKSQVLLLKKEALSGRAYHNVFEDITWEESTLRRYLNTVFLTQTFSEKEQDNIILTNVKNSDNSRFDTAGGNDTKDYIFLLSADEVQKYYSLFKGFKSNSWLRSPGNSPRSAAFLSVNGSVMDYGYMVDCEEFTIRPALWFNID